MILLLVFFFFTSIRSRSSFFSSSSLFFVICCVRCLAWPDPTTPPNQTLSSFLTWPNLFVLFLLTFLPSPSPSRIHLDGPRLRRRERHHRHRPTHRSPARADEGRGRSSVGPTQPSRRATGDHDDVLHLIGFFSPEYEYRRVFQVLSRGTEVDSFMRVEGERRVATARAHRRGWTRRRSRDTRVNSLALVRSCSRAGSSWWRALTRDEVGERDRVGVSTERARGGGSEAMQFDRWVM